MAFLYNNNELSEINSGGKCHLQLHHKKVKYLEINLNKVAKDLYFKNYKTLKEIEDDT